MIGIVGILLLGSLAWSAVGALFAALGDATAAFPLGKPPATRVAALVAATTTPRLIATTVATPVGTAVPTIRPTEVAPATPQPTPTTAAQPTATTATQPTATALPTPVVAGRAPWILLPQPEPGSRVAPGSLVVEARGRGDAPITTIRLELDGVVLPVSVEQRSDSTWRGAATTQVGAGRHAVKATVQDDHGRSGGFSWTFDAGP
jgi:hypothetical protein